VVVPTGVFAATDDWGTEDAAAGRLADRIARAAGELADLVARQPAGPTADPFESPTPYADLLRDAGRD
jgi:FMN reductase